MFPKFLWINARSLPFQGFSFHEPVDELVLTLENVGEIKNYFNTLEHLIKKGLYALGFITYEVGYLLEQRLIPYFRPPHLPLAHFCLFKSLQKETLSPLKEPIKFKISSSKLNLTQEEYKEAILKIKNYIAKGDTYQVNFTTKFHFSFQGFPWELFQCLLFSQRCEYACYLNFPSYTLLSLSPELFLKKTKNNLVSSPMKGTLKRGYSYREDISFKENLREDPKCQAENIMIVDLIRNDLGRVCEKGSVWVKNLFQIKTYPTLHQMISIISGTLEQATLFEVFKALFPCGSVTGAPKIRTMEIIRELEKEPRNVYTGAIGYITPKGDYVFNVSIRTALFFPEKKDKYRGELGVGAGIVWDSLPYKEYLETKLKASFFFKPLPYFFLFETFRWDEEKENPLLLFHYKRLCLSAKYFKFKFPKEWKNFQGFKEFLKNKLATYKGTLRVKLLLTPEGEIKLELSPMSFFSWGKPLRVGLLKRKSPPQVFHFHKTSLRQEYDKARVWAQKLGLQEVLFYNERGELLEGTISNLFWERDGILYTPPLSLGLLPGVLRESLLREKKAKERIITLKDLEKEQGSLYIGNSLRGLGKVENYIIIEGL